MSAHLELRTEHSSGAPGTASSQISPSLQDLAANNVGTELERHAIEVERCMARVRRALHQLEGETCQDSPGVLLEIARKAATAAAAADTALEHLVDATRSTIDLEE